MNVKCPVILLCLLISSPSLPQARWASLQMTSPAQTAEASDKFDVAAIHPSNPNDDGFSMNEDPAHFSMKGATVAFMIQYAYHIHATQMLNAPKWVTQARFDVNTTVETRGGSHAEDSAMSWNQRREISRGRLRHLLADRFHLSVDQRSAQVPGFVLLVDRAGSKMKQATVNNGYTIGPGHLDSEFITMDDLVWLLGDYANGPVVNRTGLQGGYKASLDWDVDPLTPSHGESLPDLHTALPEQLGLRLQKQMTEVPVVAIKTITKPDDN